MFNSNLTVNQIKNPTVAQIFTVTKKKIRKHSKEVCEKWMIFSEETLSLIKISKTHSFKNFVWREHIIVEAERNLFKKKYHLIRNLRKFCHLWRFSENPLFLKKNHVFFSVNPKFASFEESCFFRRNLRHMWNIWRKMWTNDWQKKCEQTIAWIIVQVVR